MTLLDLGPCKIRKALILFQLWNKFYKVTLVLGAEWSTPEREQPNALYGVLSPCAWYLKPNKFHNAYEEYQLVQLSNNANEFEVATFQ